jgi:hypothetical protein
MRVFLLLCDFAAIVLPLDLLRTDMHFVDNALHSHVKKCVPHVKFVVGFLVHVREACRDAIYSSMSCEDEGHNSILFNQNTF